MQQPVRNQGILTRALRPIPVTGLADREQSAGPLDGDARSAITWIAISLRRDGFRTLLPSPPAIFRRPLSTPHTSSSGAGFPLPIPLCGSSWIYPYPPYLAGDILETVIAHPALPVQFVDLNTDLGIP